MGTHDDNLISMFVHVQQKKTNTKFNWNEQVWSFNEDNAYNNINRKTWTRTGNMYAGRQVQLQK